MRNTALAVPPSPEEIAAYLAREDAMRARYESDPELQFKADQIHAAWTLSRPACIQCIEMASLVLSETAA